MAKKWFLLILAVLGIFYFISPAEAQTISLNVDDVTSNGSATARIFNVIMLITVLSIAPSILVMMTLLFLVFYGDMMSIVRNTEIIVFR